MDLQLPPQQQTYQQIYWPIFGEKQPSQVKKFWNKGKNESLLNDQCIYECELHRIGNKKTKMKLYFFKVSNKKDLYYFKKRSDRFPKGTLKLNDQIQMKLSQFQVEKEQKILGIKLYRTDKVTYTLISNNNQLIFLLWEILAKICVMNNFEDMYQPMNLLGKGSFATVYKVKKIVDDNYYAAKIYYKDTLSANQHKEKFVNMVKNESLILRKIEHENIAKIHEVFQQNDKVVLVMDFVGGPDLYQLIKRKKCISEKTAAMIINQLAQALQELQKNEFVHRDLKLENILLQSHDSYKIKLVDFGFSEKINYTQLLSKAGTPGYIPPELFYNKPYTEKGDIFSLGVILFSLVGGYSPFKGRNYKEIMEQNKYAQIQFQKSIWLSISEECKQLIVQMCQEDPDARPSIQQILQNEWIKKYDEENQKYEMSLHLIQSQRENFDEFQLNIQNNGVPSFYQRSYYTMKSVHHSQKNDEVKVEDEINEQLKQFDDFEQFLNEHSETDQIDQNQIKCLSQGLKLTMKKKLSVQTNKN